MSKEEAEEVYILLRLGQEITTIGKYGKCQYKIVNNTLYFKEENIDREWIQSRQRDFNTIYTNILCQEVLCYD